MVSRSFPLIYPENVICSGQSFGTPNAPVRSVCMALSFPQIPHQDTIPAASHDVQFVCTALQNQVLRTKHVACNMLRPFSFLVLAGCFLSYDFCRHSESCRCRLHRKDLHQSPDSRLCKCPSCTARLTCLAAVASCRCSWLRRVCGT